MTHHLAQPVTIRGVLYPTQRAAAAALGICETTLCNALRKGRADTAGVGKAITPVVVDGVTYPSMSAAARALGVNWNTINRRISAGKVQVAK